MRVEVMLIRPSVEPERRREGVVGLWDSWLG
jgi:hypothetical protein